MRLLDAGDRHAQLLFTLSPDQKGIETADRRQVATVWEFTLSPDQKGIETKQAKRNALEPKFTLSPDQKGIETPLVCREAYLVVCSH